jgi:hypothetical protein
MNGELPDRMPPRPPPTTRVPHAFSIWGTLIYGSCSAAAGFFMIDLVWIIPPWYVLLATFFYVFVSTGIIALGRVEANRDAKFFIEALKRQSEENKLKVRKMN